MQDTLNQLGTPELLALAAALGWSSVHSMSARRCASARLSSQE